MSEVTVITLPKADHVTEDHVTISQCSNKSIPSEDEILPLLIPRVSQSRAESQAKVRPTFSNTYRRETSDAILKYVQTANNPTYKNTENVYLNNEPELRNELLSERSKLSDDNDEKLAFLPRLNDSDQRQNCVNKRSIDPAYVRFPEISNISKKNGRLALNRSITDLLDPEMEILNRIKHIPRRKRKKKRKKLDCGTPV